MKAYEDEMERVAAKAAKKVLQRFGFKFEKREGAQRESNPRKPHISELCEACRVGVCTEGTKVRRARKEKKRGGQQQQNSD